MATLLIVPICLGSLIFVALIKLLWTGRKLKAHKYWIFAESAAWRFLIPSWTEIPWVTYGVDRPYKVKHMDFAQAGQDGYVQMALTTPTTPTIFLADPQAIKEATRSRSPIVQDVELTKVFLGMFGPNVSTLEGDKWMHHRKISLRAFTEKNIHLVWSETALVTKQLMEQWDEHGRVVHVSDVTRMTEKLALMIVSSAALGQRLSWNDDSNKAPPDGYSVSFQQALDTVSRQILLWLVVPSWAEGWTTTTRSMAVGFKDYRKYLRDMLSDYKNQGRLDEDMIGTKSLESATTENIFNVMVSASEQVKFEEGEGLADEDIIGNAFLLLFAGHETTANALGFSLGLLALYPDIQQEVYAQISSSLGERKHLEFDDLSKLKLVSGTFMESLRMYPVLAQSPKLAVRDTVLSVALNGPETDETDRAHIIIPAGSTVVFSNVAIHYNPRYWPEPERFRPARFVEPYNKDAFLAFGTGRRSCIGRKFAETEGTAALATILARYKISVDSTKFPSISGETAYARQERLLQRPAYFLAGKPGDMPLVFTRR